MAIETEIKFSLNARALQQLDTQGEQLLANFNPQVSEQQALVNAYYDTPAHTLHQKHAALRVRGCNGKFEQTLKTKGDVAAGLHQREELNVDIAGPELEQDKLPAMIHTLLSAEELSTLEPIFTTNFKRQSIRLKPSTGVEIEYALDTGQIEAQDREDVISEIELELISGDIADLFDIAEALLEKLELRLSSISKAERAFRLLADDAEEFTKFTEVPIKLSSGASIEDSLVTVLSAALRQWQAAEAVLLERNNVEALKSFLTGLESVIDTINIYNSVLLRRSSHSLREQLHWLHEQVNWIHKITITDALLERIQNDSDMFTSLPEREQFAIALESALTEQLIAPCQALRELISSRPYQQLMLQFVRWLSTKAWRAAQKDETLSALRGAIEPFAFKQLNHFLKELRVAFSTNKRLNKSDYFAQQTKLQKALHVGKCFGSIFAGDARARFRQFWLDIHAGIIELQQLDDLSVLSKPMSPEQKEAVETWLNRQRESLFEAMYQTRKVALTNKPYWK